MSDTVLIVDDSLTVRMDLVDAFVDAGFRCLPCGTAAEARAAVARESVQAVILDVLLPDGDGVDLLKELRASPAGASIAILMLSSEAEVKDRIRGLQTGADEYVGKPYDLGYLVAAVRKLIDARNEAAASTAESAVLVVDDSATFRAELSHAFTSAGYKVQVAASGEEGLRLAALRRPAAVVVDGVMPGIDGATVIRRLRLDAALRDVPCLLLTAAEDDGVELLALEAGADAFVRKHEDVSIILAKLRAVLRQSAARRPPDETTSLQGPKKLLAIDDSPTYLHELQGALRTDGYDVILAHSGEEALELLAVQTVDCVLLDLMMPGLGGEETCRLIKASPATRDVPLIMLTALEDRQAMIRGLGAGADDYIQKSSDLTILRARVRAQLRRKQFEDENRRIRDELLRKEIEATEARAARALAETRATLVEELEHRVTERTAALRESEESLAITLDSIGDAVVATDVAGNVVRMNAVAEALTGWTAKDAAGRPLARVCRLVDEQTGAPLEDLVVEVLRRGAAPVGSVPNQNLLLARDGRARPVARSGAPIRDAQGQVRGVVLVLRDQTEERRMQRMQAEARELQAENRHILETSRMKGEFLANMSHELRTPLNAIIGFAELLHGGDVDAGAKEHREFLGYILESGRHLLQLINDVLDLSKVEAGKFQFLPEPVNLTVLVDEVLGILRAMIASKGTTVVREIDPGLTDIVLDGSRCKQVLYNYLSNALKFTPKGGLVTVRARPEGERNFRLEVEDTGIGIAPQDIDRLFVEFQQLEAGAAKRHAGTGLGLALTKRLVEAQGGSVGVHSTLGQGSTFYAIYPRRAAVAAAAKTGKADQGRAGLPRVLIIEDDPRDSAIVAETLVSAGYAVDTATTGYEALHKCRQQAFNAITLDLLLPDIGGADVLRKIRSEGKNQDVPVVVVTVIPERGAVAGFAVHDLLPKPLDGGALLASLQRTGILAHGAQDGRSVLVVDDDPAALKLMSIALGQLGCKVICEDGGEAGLRAARAAPPLALVLDLCMPGMDGFTFLHHFRQLPGCQAVPVVIWTVKDLDQDEMARLRDSARVIITRGESPSAAVVAELRAFLPERPSAGKEA